MANFDSAKTKSGVELPLMNLKGKAYMLVAHRILWLNEDVERFTISTEYPVLNTTEAVVRATVCIYNNEGNLLKSSTATKREEKKDFNDFTEKAETGAIGRAVTLLGYGTAFALADLAEGERIIDAPLAAPDKKASKEPMIVYTAKEAGKVAVTPDVEVKAPVVQATLDLSKLAAELTVPVEAPKKTTFRKPSTKAVESPKKAGGWD